MKQDQHLLFFFTIQEMHHNLFCLFGIKILEFWNVLKKIKILKCFEKNIKILEFWKF